MTFSGLKPFIIGLSFLLVSSARLDNFDGENAELQPLDDMNKYSLNQDNKRGSWANFRGSWGKRANWNKLHGMWGKRMVEVPSDTYAAILLQEPSSVAGQDVEEIVYPIDALPIKRSWQRFAGSWGKRGSGSKVISPRSTNWSSLRGSWGKRAGNWNQFRGSWGKRSSDSLEDTSKAE